ncbi:carbohydrate-binding family 9-like protein [Gelidibacter maritimus]|uniref:Endoxylanase n=1 Tax=Gelidibacter maritimus TaxID=2761487 RepID=A0A7W2M534_9FLAO|nr:carbohydrate-binding family 9-like protein [Gelidibacter maritimus]MBA6152865.1 endoxylanase [Gelidibacter maritimus]
MKTYKVNVIDSNIMEINGKANHPLWENAVVLKDFSSPWISEDFEDIEFRALYDGTHLFVAFKVNDSSLHMVSTDNSKKSVDNSDRVELFLRSDKHLNPYYCLEIDPLARVQDFMARPNKVFDYQWDWPKQDLNIKSNITSKSFTVELAISIDSLKRFNLIQKDGHIEAGIYRAKYNQKQDGQFEPTWITWIDPQTETPNFHTASSFGKLKLVNF